EGVNLASEALASVGDIDNAVINLHFANGAIGNVEVSRNALMATTFERKLLGSEGAVSIGDPAVAAEAEHACSLVRLSNRMAFRSSFAASKPRTWHRSKTSSTVWSTTDSLQSVALMHWPRLKSPALQRFRGTPASP